MFTLMHSHRPAAVRTFRVGGWRRDLLPTSSCRSACWPLAAGGVWAAGKGQEDLDKATDVKLNAVTISDLSEVIRLSESALKKGLDKGNVEFANQLLASTLVQRAQRDDQTSPGRRQFA